MEKETKPSAEKVHERQEVETENREEARERAARKKAKKTKRMIYNIVATILVVFILFEGILGIINVQKLNNGEEPVFCFGTSQETKDGEEITTYHMGLYVIKKTVSSKENKTELKPFFL